MTKKPLHVHMLNCVTEKEWPGFLAIVRWTMFQFQGEHTKRKKWRHINSYNLEDWTFQLTKTLDQNKPIYEITGKLSKNDKVLVLLWLVFELNVSQTAGNQYFKNMSGKICLCLTFCVKSSDSFCIITTFFFLKQKGENLRIFWFEWILLTHRRTLKVSIFVTGRKAALLR